MVIKTDGDVMKLANKIDKLSREINDMIAAIGNSEHPNAQTIAEALYDQCSFIAWANHVAHSCLEHPEQWVAPEYEGGGIGRYYHASAKKAKQTRFENKIARLKALKAVVR